MAFFKLSVDLLLMFKKSRGRRSRVGRQPAGVRDPGSLYLCALPQVASIPEATSRSKRLLGLQSSDGHSSQRGGVRGEDGMAPLRKLPTGPTLCPIGQNFVKGA